MSQETLSGRLKPYKQSAIAEAVGVRGATVHTWYHGQSFPAPEHYPALARILRMSIEELADLIASEQKSRALARAAEAVA